MNDDIARLSDLREDHDHADTEGDGRIEVWARVAGWRRPDEILHYEGHAAPL